MVRAIEPGELKACMQLEAMAFSHPDQEAELTSAQMEAQRDSAPRSRQDREWRTFYGNFEGPVLTACLQALPFQMNIEGTDVPMAGIAGVASRPEYRRQGRVRELFSHLLPELHRQGAIISYLYPFSTAFYGRFGYAPAFRWVEWEIALCAIREAEVPGQCIPVTPENAKTLLPKLLEAEAGWHSLYTGMVRNEEIDLAWACQDPYAAGEYTYLYLDGEGKPRGYVTLRPVRTAPAHLDCVRFVADGEEARGALLSLLGRYQADFSFCRLRLPENVSLDRQIGEWSFGYVKRQLQLRGMARALNVGALLSLHRAGADGIRLGIRDALVKENEGVYLCEGNGGPLTAERCQGPADLTLDIGDFTRLLLGICRPEETALSGHDREIALARALFPERPGYICRYF